MNSPEAHERAFEDIYTHGGSDWAAHFGKDPLTRFLRDRRLSVAFREMKKKGLLRVDRQSVLVICGGVGGEGSFLRRCGFDDVTVSDFSTSSLELCNSFDPTIKTLKLNAESIDLPDESFDIVVVQDGLHHLLRPTLGLTEMLRVAKSAVVVIEPHYGLVGQVFGTKWEVHGEVVNYVFRWNRTILEQCTRSFLLLESTEVVTRRIWDHNLVVMRVVGHLPGRFRLAVARLIYALLRPLSRFGNMMIGIVIKK